MEHSTQERLMEFSDMIDEFLSNMKMVSSEIESFGYEEERRYYALSEEDRDSDDSLRILDFKRGLLKVFSTLESANILIRESKTELDELISKSIDDIGDEVFEDIDEKDFEIDEDDGFEDDEDGEFYPVLEVKTSGGDIFYNGVSSKTFCDVISHIGVELVASLKIYIGDLPLVTKRRYKKRYKSLGSGWYIHTNSSTTRKKQLLVQISEKLDLNYKIRLVQPR